MKKIMLSILAVMLLFSALAMAQYTGPSATATTVKEALTLPDDAMVTLTGKITKRLSDEHYEFSDGTGVIPVKIDKKLWDGLTVGANDTVELLGEIDRGFVKRTVDVKRINKK